MCAAFVIIMMTAMQMSLSHLHTAGMSGNIAGIQRYGFSIQGYGFSIQRYGFSMLEYLLAVLMLRDQVFGFMQQCVWNNVETKVACQQCRYNCFDAAAEQQGTVYTYNVHIHIMLLESR